MCSKHRQVINFPAIGVNFNGEYVGINEIYCYEITII